MLFRCSPLRFAGSRQLHACECSAITCHPPLLPQLTLCLCSDRSRQKQTVSVAVASQAIDPRLACPEVCSSFSCFLVLRTALKPASRSSPLPVGCRSVSLLAATRSSNCRWHLSRRGIARILFPSFGFRQEVKHRLLLTLDFVADNLQ